MSNLTLTDLGSRTVAGKWIQKAHLKKGAFTAKAQAAGKSVGEYAAEKADAPGKLGKQARLAQTFRKMAGKSPLHDNPRSK
jgi:malonyl CoA-acyl carrier protein transacylase